jgi:hypothetical protein
VNAGMPPKSQMSDIFFLVRSEYVDFGEYAFTLQTKLFLFEFHQIIFTAPILCLCKQAYLNYRD